MKKYNQKWYGKLIPISLNQTISEIDKKFLDQLEEIEQSINSNKLSEAERKIKELEKTLSEENIPGDNYQAKIKIFRSKIACRKCDNALNNDYKGSKYILRFLKDPDFNLSDYYQSAPLKRLFNDLIDFDYSLKANKSSLNLTADKVFEIFSKNIIDYAEGSLVSQYFVDSLIEVKNEIILSYNADTLSSQGDTISNFILKNEYLNLMLNKESQQNKFLAGFISSPENMIANKKIYGNKKNLMISIFTERDVEESGSLFTIITEMKFYFKLVAENRYLLNKQVFKSEKIPNTNQDYGKL